jgi:hypothetical protein
MDQTRSRRTWTFVGAAVLALSVGVMIRRTSQTPMGPPEEMRDAVAAAPISPAMLGGARVIQPNTGYFASPAGRRAEAERAMLSSRMTKVSKAMQNRAAQLRRDAARERALAVSAQ